jgi:hypothetical protein
MGALGERARDVILKQGRADTGGDLILSNFARGRIKLDVAVEVGAATVKLTPTPIGPWTLLEDGSHRGAWFEPRKGRKRRVKLPDGNVRRYVRHGKVRAKRTFTRARAQCAVLAPAWFDLELRALVRRDAA